MPTHTLRIALLHLAPIPGDLTGNRRLVEKAVTAAARLGATWIITPELIVTGYTFADSIGTEWILPQPDSWMTRMSTTRRPTARDPVPILSRAGSKIPQVLQ